mmetsp:Transcript_39864/g.46413  ORF Transcript_39864/g.46413 Transcript_39864/m.46413 type:complete len:118 (-) Transcript_39864:119-472(-)
MTDRDDGKIIKTSGTKLFKTAITFGSNPSKEDLVTILHWLRQLFALVFGLAVGIGHLTGFPIILGFLGINIAFVHIYANKYIQIDEDKIEQQDLYTESLGLSFAVFLITWTLSHTYL